MASVNHSPIRSRTDYESSRHVEYDARKVQRKLIAALPEEYQLGIAKWRLVQLGHVPSIRTIVNGLYQGLYRELL